MESLKGLVLISRTAILYQTFEERITLLEQAVKLFAIQSCERFYSICLQCYSSLFCYFAKVRKESNQLGQPALPGPTNYLLSPLIECEDPFKINKDTRKLINRSEKGLE